MASAEPALPGAFPSARDYPIGLPIAFLAALALLASFSGRVLAPALFGAASGIERTIQIVQATANLSSPMVAVGAIAFTLRAVAVTVAKGSLGVGYRLLAIPTAIAVSALVMAAIGRVLEPPLVSALAVSALVTAALSAPLALKVPATRAIGLILALTALSGALDFAGVRLSLFAVEHGSATQFRHAALLVTLGFGVEVVLVAVAFTTLSSRRPGRAALLMAASVAATIAVAWVVRAGTSVDSSTWQVVVARAVGELLRPPSPLVPASARLTLEIASLVAALTALVATRRSPIAALVALCLVARGSIDVPIPALLLVVAAITMPAYLQPRVSV